MRPNVIDVANDNCYQCCDTTVRPANTVCGMAQGAFGRAKFLFPLVRPTPPLIDEVNGRPSLSQVRNHSDEPLFYEFGIRKILESIYCLHFLYFFACIIDSHIFCCHAAGSKSRGVCQNILSMGSTLISNTFDADPA